MTKQTDNPEHEGENQNGGNNGDDNFGLPSLDYKPLDSNEQTEIITEQTPLSDEVVNEGTTSEQDATTTLQEEPKSNAPVIIAVIIGLVLIVAAFLAYQYVYKPRAEKARLEQLAKQEEVKKRKEEEARLAKEKQEAERNKLESEKVVVVEKPAEGTIETLSQRTGRYHVIITSDVDDDLVMDFAKKLSANGISTKIIPPYGKKKFYRLAIGDFDTFADGQASADQLKATYGNSVWVIKY